MGKIILVTGGQRSGKSTYAEELVLKLSGKEKSVYMATSRIWDEEFARRVYNGEDVAACVRDDVNHIAQCDRLAQAYEVGLHKLVKT